MKSTFFLKFKQDDDDLIFAKAEWDEDKNIDILFVNSKYSKTWSCKLLKKEIEQLGKKLRIDEINQWSKECFQGY